MKHRVLGSLTAAFVVSSLGTALSASARQIDDLDPTPASEIADTSDPGSEESSAVVQSATPTELSADGSSPADSIIAIYSHAFDQRQAATLYVQGIPVLTFVGSELETLATTKQVAAESSASDDLSPAERAAQVGDLIDQLYAGGHDAEDIRVRWEAESGYYVIFAAEQNLVAINSQTILPDTTGDMAEDALHVANRLRRLLGEASPLEEIEGRPTPPAPVVSVTSTTTGMASWYGPGFHGRRSASGEVFNQHALTAAHRTLPFGTRVRVTNLNTRRQVVVRINDRGPFSHGRIIDLSAGAADAIGLIRSGVAPVQVEVLAP